MKTKFNHQEALELLRKYNQQPFHILHGLTVEGCMRWFARDQGFEEEEDFWGIAGLLHDIDFERYPEEHCRKAPELLEEAKAEPELIHAVVSHGYGICSQVEPEHPMEKILFAVDELTGHYKRSRTVRLEPGGTDGEKHSGHAFLRGGDSPGDGGSGAESLKKILFRCRLTANTVYWTEDSSGRGLSGKSCSAGKDRV